jgi:hypothetical protein
MMADKEIMTGRVKRDGAAYAFRKYARLGLDRRSLRPFEVYDVIRGVCRSEEEAQQLLAVYDTVRLLALASPEALLALRAVYFFNRGKKPLKNQIGHRVLRFASDNHCDERTVYRRLREAKEMYYHLLIFDK